MGPRRGRSDWDAAIVILILGGAAGSDDLRDLSALLGTCVENYDRARRDAASEATRLTGRIETRLQPCHGSS
jgi:hypothetical protein